MVSVLARRSPRRGGQKNWSTLVPRDSLTQAMLNLSIAIRTDGPALAATFSLWPASRGCDTPIVFQPKEFRNKFPLHRGRSGSGKSEFLRLRDDSNGIEMIRRPFYPPFARGSDYTGFRSCDRKNPRPGAARERLIACGNGHRRTKVRYWPVIQRKTCVNCRSIALGLRCKAAPGHPLSRFSWQASHSRPIWHIW